jgi:hypothetical protein
MRCLCPGPTEPGRPDTMVFKALGWGAAIIFIIGLLVVIGVLSLIF